MKAHKVTLIISDKKLKEIAQFIMYEKYTGSFIPDLQPAQDLAMAVCLAVKLDQDLITLNHDDEIHKIIEKTNQKEQKS